MVSRTAVIVVLLPLFCAAVGCFDIHAVDPGPYVLDDFEDGDYLPADPNFGVWMCFAFNPDTNHNYACALDSGFNSNHSLRLDFTVNDIPNQTQDHGGAALGTSASHPQDFSGLKEMVFYTRLESGSPPLPSDALYYVQMGCSTAQDRSGEVPGDFYVLQGVDFSSDWRKTTLPLASFGPPPWDKRQIKGGVAGCLQRVDSFQFVIDEQLPDGQSGTGILHIDNILLQ